MERKQHIEMMRRIGVILDGQNLPDAAKQHAINYARRLATDAALQASVRQSFKSDLAERDLRRAFQVAAKEGAPITESTSAAKAEVKQAAEAKKYTRSELEDYGIVCRVTHCITIRGEAWKAEGRPDAATWVYNAA